MKRAVAVLVVFLMVVSLSGCEVWWRSGRFDAANTGFNPAEHTLTLDGVAGLQVKFTAAVGAVDASWNGPVVANGFVYVSAHDVLEVYRADGSAGCTGAPLVCVPVWTGDTSGGNTLASPVVADGSVFVATTNGLRVFDASGVANCTGAPAVCAPLWTAPFGYRSPPTVAHGLAYLAGPSTIVALDAHGEQGCSGTPKVCAPLWQVNAPWFDFSSRTIPTVGETSMFTIDYGGHVAAYDTTASAACTGAPVTCPVRWTSVFSLADDASGDGYLGWTGPVLVGSRLLVYRLRHETDYPYTLHRQLAAFDASGVDGCRANNGTNLGGSTICDPLWSTDVPGLAQNSQLAAAYGLVYAITRTGVGSTDQVSAYRIDGAGCGGVPMTCPIQWQSTPVLSGKWSFPIVANHVLYQGTADGIAAFDAAGAGCAPAACPPVEVGPMPAASQNLAVADGRLYALSAGPDNFGYGPTTVMLTVYGS